MKRKAAHDAVTIGVNGITHIVNVTHDKANVFEGASSGGGGGPTCMCVAGVRRRRLCWLVLIGAGWC